VTSAVLALLERASIPLPSGPVPAHTAPAVVVGTPTGHPVDLVQVLMRRGGSAPLVIRALRDAANVDDPAQWFRAQLPALEPDREAEYRVEWLRAGRRIATLPADGSWYHLRGVADGAQDPSSKGPGPARPRFGYDLEFFATGTFNLSAQPIGPTPQGYRVNFAVTDGRMVGPGIDAVVEPHGGDWMRIRPDGIGEVDIKITLRTRDGALIFEQAGGVFDTGPDGFAQMAAGTLGGARSLYVTPTWSTAHPAWMWLNRRQGFAVGRVQMATLQVQVDVYLPTVQV
jgi:Protein of unknown function (DUF3237)